MVIVSNKLISKRIALNNNTGLWIDLYWCIISCFTNRWGIINRLSLGNTYMHNKAWLALIQIMARFLLGTKSLTEPVLIWLKKIWKHHQVLYDVLPRLNRLMMPQSFVKHDIKHWYNLFIAQCYKVLSFWKRACSKRFPVTAIYIYIHIIFLIIIQVLFKTYWKIPICEICVWMLISLIRQIRAPENCVIINSSKDQTSANYQVIKWTHDDLIHENTF